MMRRLLPRRVWLQALWRHVSKCHVSHECTYGTFRGRKTNETGKMTRDGNEIDGERRKAVNVVDMWAEKKERKKKMAENRREFLNPIM